MKTPALVVFAALLCACEAPPQSVKSGIYDFTTTSVSDTCTPKRAVFSGSTDVHQRGDAVSLMIPDSAITFASRTRFDIPLGGYERTRVAPLGECPSGTVKTKLDVTSYGNPFIVELVKEFTDVKPGTGNCATDIPSADCKATLRFEYTLVFECAAHCSVREESPLTGVLRCECPDAGR